MKINELISMANQDKNKLMKMEQKQNWLKKVLDVKNYLGIKDKRRLVQDIVNECLYYEGGIFKFDDIEKYVCFIMKTIAAYTNIELSEDMENDYDMLCEAKLLDVIVSTFKGEYDEVNVLLQMRCDYILSDNNIEAQVGKFLTNLSDKLDMLVDKMEGFNLDKLPINKEDLGKVLEFANMHQK